MRTRPEYYEPDWIDVNTQLTALGKDWYLVCKFEVICSRDTVSVVARCYCPSSPNPAGVVVQALASRPLKSKPQIAVMAFATALDCWHQMDRGVLGARPPAVSRGWNGRPNIARLGSEE